MFEGDTSRVVQLPDDGEVFVGRAKECEVSLADDGVSRRHVRLELKHGQVGLSDLGSHNGTRVNGQRAGADVPLAAGDVITVSDTTLVLHCGARPQASRPVHSPKGLRERLAAELERASRFERSFCLAGFRFAAPPDPAEVERKLKETLRLMDVASWVDGVLFVLLPEVDRAEAAAQTERIVEALAAGGHEPGAGFAVFPEDGSDADTLLLAARQAAAAAKTGALESAEHSVRRITLGERREVLVADPSMSAVYALLERLAKAALPVLVLGETGTGKENAAFAVHHFSGRAKGPFVGVNCAGLPETLLESELFGYEKGAFTGATSPKQGLLEASHGGTAFLDEVGELSLAAQGRLLRVLETKRITRIGSVKEKELDLRIVAATHRDLAADVKAGRFREDLFFRLSAAVVNLPPLRERRREVPLLARLFAENAASLAGRPAPLLSGRTLAALARHDWPGNVRELKNAMEFAVATATGPLIDPEHLPASSSSAAPAQGTPAAKTGFVPLAQELKELERRRMKEALEAAGGVQTKAAELIGMPRRTFVLKLRELRLGEGS
ncbi:MAG: sigma 54-interacting transcriptional regulator [Myxococcaceae bacterium]|nr:sigma 54-interacting transcriptional regulator [Myxococcaceae bacterium]